MSSKDELLNQLLGLFNCNIDFEELKFIFNEYYDFKDNSKINVLNYPKINSLITNQNKRKEDFIDLVDGCFSEGLCSKYGLIECDGKLYVVELSLQEFEDKELLEEYYKNFIL